MHCIALLFAVLSLASANRIIFPDSFNKASTASKGDPPAAGRGTASEKTGTRSFFHPSFGGEPGNLGDFDGGAHFSGGFGGSGFDVPPPPHGPHGSHHDGFGSGLSSAGPHSPLSTFPLVGLQPQHVGPVIPVIDPLSANIEGNPGGFPVSGGCRFWCRTPKGQVYCCEDANAPQNPVGVKPGVCPPSRPVCPPTRSFGPPAPCSNDGSCAGVDKCCFDTCLQEHTCKPPEGFGR